jgi:hypothetical protein
MASRPFSIHRRGFVVSEGAGCIILASEAFARAHGLAHDLAIAGWSMTSDAHHFVAPHFDTVRRCIQESIDRAGIAPEDRMRSTPMPPPPGWATRWNTTPCRRFSARRLPPVTANKSLIGHAMGASSAIESILAPSWGCATGCCRPPSTTGPIRSCPSTAWPKGAARWIQDLCAEKCVRFRRVQFMHRFSKDDHQ